MRRTLTTTLLVTLLLVLLATPALAHASFDIRQVPAGASESYSLRVPLERAPAGNEAIAVQVPAGWTVDSCTGATGWSCTSDVQTDGTTLVSLQRTDGLGTVERFALDLTAPATTGVHVFAVVQTYDDGTEVAWIGEPGTDHPAPRIQVGDDTTVVERGPDLPTHDEGTENAPQPTEVDDGLTELPTAEATPSDGATDASEAAVDDATPSPAGSVDMTVVAIVVAGLAAVGALGIKQYRDR